ncbi:MAG: cyclic nucleotide-binding domain-containing protein [Pseudomonadota bacterium]
MIDLLQRIMLLKAMPLFAESYTEDLEAIAEVLKEDSCLVNDCVFKRGDPSDRFFIIAEGRIGISFDDADRERTYIARLGPGECFGEMGLLDGEPRSASAWVLEDARLLYMEKAKLHNVLVRQPEIGLGMLAHLSRMVRDCNRERSETPGESA